MQVWTAQCSQRSNVIQKFLQAGRIHLFTVVKYVDIPDTVHLALVLVKEIHLSSA